TPGVATPAPKMRPGTSVSASQYTCQSEPASARNVAQAALRAVGGVVHRTWRTSRTDAPPATSVSGWPVRAGGRTTARAKEKREISTAAQATTQVLRIPKRPFPLGRAGAYINRDRKQRAIGRAPDRTHRRDRARRW